MHGVEYRGATAALRVRHQLLCEGCPPAPGGSGRSPLPSGTSAVCFGCGFERGGLVAFAVSVGSPGCVVVPVRRASSCSCGCFSSICVPPGRKAVVMIEAVPAREYLHAGVEGLHACTRSVPFALQGWR